MKFSFNFDLAIILSFFTGYLYWCGYWYQYGYTSYFNYPITPYELPLITTIIQGLLISIEGTLYLTLSFVFIAFLSGFSSKQWDFGITKLSAWCANFIILVYFLMSKRFNPFFENLIANKIIKFYMQFQTLNPQNVETNNQATLPLLTTQNSKWAKFKRWIITLNQDSKTYTNQVMFKQNMTTEAISYQIYGRDKRTSEAQNVLKTVLYFMLIFLILLLLMWMLKSGTKAINRGYQDAHLNYVYTFSHQKENSAPIFPLVISKTKPELRNYHLTDFCMQGSCLLVNKNKNVQTFKIDDLIIKNRPNSD
ncbi:MAG: hypothetical protein ACN6NV_08465 [Acinetobacter gandensis]|uniref:hypothetical protein n=1 Tax=Acinetobacter gandensis TaxID=1443941 RepID=UPI003D011DA4